MHWAGWAAIFVAAAIPVVAAARRRKGQSGQRPAIAMTVAALAMGLVAIAS